MNWAAAMKWGRILSRSCRIVFTDDTGHLRPGHRHAIRAYRPHVGSELGPWVFKVACTNDLTAYRPTSPAVRAARDLARRI